MAVEEAYRGTGNSIRAPYPSYRWSGLLLCDCYGVPSRRIRRPA
jgi:hypothetical protein